MQAKKNPRLDAGALFHALSASRSNGPRFRRAIGNAMANTKGVSIAPHIEHRENGIARRKHAKTQLKRRFPQYLASRQFDPAQTSITAKTFGCGMAHFSYNQRLMFKARAFLLILFLLAKPSSRAEWPDAAPDSINTMFVQALDYVVNPSSGRVYAAIQETNGPSIIAITPRNGARETILPSQKATQLAISDNGAMLYAVTDNQTRVMRLDLRTGEVLFIQPTLPPASASLQINDIAVQPGSERVLALTVSYIVYVGNYGMYDAYKETRLYEDAQQRANAVFFGDRLEFLNSAKLMVFNRSIPTPLGVLSVNAAGVTLDASPTDNLIRSGFDVDVQSIGNALISWDAALVDPIAKKTSHPFPGVGDWPNTYSFFIDPARRRAGFLMVDPNYPQPSLGVRVYDLDTFLPLGTASKLPKSIDLRLLRYGADGLVYRRTTNEMVFARTSLIPDGEPTDLELTSEPAALLPGSTNRWRFTFTAANLGSQPADRSTFNAEFWVKSKVIADTNLAGATFTTNKVVFPIGTMQPGERKTVSVVVEQYQLEPPTGIATLNGAAADPVMANNSVLVSAPLRTNALPLVFKAPLDFARDDSRGALLVFPGSSIPYIGDSVVKFDPATGVTAARGYLGRAVRAIWPAGDSNSVFVETAEKLIEIDTESLATKREIPLASGLPILALKVNPANSNQVAVVFNNTLAYPAESLVTVYDGTTELAHSGAASRVIAALWQDANHLRILARGAGAPVIQDFQLQPPSLQRVNELTENWLAISGNPQEQNGLVFGARGEIYDLLRTNMVGTLPLQGTGDTWPCCAGADFGPLMIPEMETGRTYSLSYVENSSWIYAYDLEHQLALERRAVLGLSAVPQKLTRWGIDGFAFRTSWNELFILRNDLPPIGLATDLALTLASEDGKLNLDGTEKVRMQIANNGTNTATNVILTIETPAANRFKFLSSAGGSLTTNSSGSVQFQLPTLAPGATIQLEGSYTGTGTSPFEKVAATVAASTADHLPSNNRAVTFLSQPQKLQSDPVAQLPLLAKSVASDATNLYATISDADAFAGNSLVKIDPANGILSAPLWVGSKPSEIALSSDGGQAFIALDGASAIQTVNLRTWSLGARFAIPTGLRCTQIEPYSPSELLLALSDKTIALYRDGLKTPSVLKDATTFAIHPETRAVYAHDKTYTGVPLFQASVSSQGLTLSATFPSAMQTSADFEINDNRLFYDNGLVVSLADSTTRRFPGTGLSRLKLFPDQNRAVCVAAAAPNPWGLSAFEITTGSPTGVLDLSLPLGQGATRLRRFSEDGLAFVFNQALILARPAFLRSANDVDLSLSASGPGSLLLNRVGTFQFVITNRGPSPAAAVEVFCVSTSFAFSNLTASQGIELPPGPKQFRWLVGDLAPGQFATITAPALALQTNIPLSATFTVTSLAHDINPINNSLLYYGQSGFSTNTTITSAVDLSLQQLITDTNGIAIVATSTKGIFGSGIIRIDPTSGWIAGVAPLPAEPGRFLQSNGKFTVLLPNVSGLIAVNRSTGAADNFVLLQEDGSFVKPVSIALNPQNPDLLAVAYYRSQQAAYVRLFKNGIALPNKATDSSGTIDLLEFSRGGETLYGLETQTSGFRFWTWGVAADGVSNVSPTYGVLFGFDNDLKRLGNRLATGAGQIYDPATQTAFTNLFPYPLRSTTVAVDEPAARLYFAVQNGSRWNLHCVNATNYSTIVTNPLPTLAGPVKDLVRYGPNGLAFRTANQLFLLRSSQVLTLPGSDADSDGLPDDWESAFGLNPLSADDASADLDGDGATTAAEFRAGTNPLSAQSVLSLQISKSTGGALQFTFPTVPGRTYQVESISDIASQTWTAFSTPITATASQTTVPFNDGFSAPMYFRLAVKP